MDVRFNVKTHFNAAESARLRAYLRKGKYASDRKSNGKISKRTTMVYREIEFGRRKTGVSISRRIEEKIATTKRRTKGH